MPRRLRPHDPTELEVTEENSVQAATAGMKNYSLWKLPGCCDDEQPAGEAQQRRLARHPALAGRNS